MNKKLIVANWKMNLNPHQASLFLHELEGKVPVHNDVEVVLCPSMLALQTLSLQVNHRHFKLGAQNCHWRDEGPFTGEVSATMLRGMARYVIVGHSERRHVFGERDTDVKMKVQAVMRNGLKPILCIGETAHERAEGETRHILQHQLTAGLANITVDEMSDLTIAYEPVWAISSGHGVHDHAAAAPDDMEKAEKTIRSHVAASFGDEAGARVRVLYGGSVTDRNAGQFLTIDGVDGLLVGGSSLNAEVFASIITQAHGRSEK